MCTKKSFAAIILLKKDLRGLCRYLKTPPVYLEKFACFYYKLIRFARKCIA